MLNKSSARNSAPHEQAKSLKKEFPNGSEGWKGPRKCKKCDKIEFKRGNMKNHSLNHYMENLTNIIPASSLVAPFPCPEPECEGKEHRDKITFLRHYAFAHRKIFDICNEEDLLGVEIDDEKGIELTLNAAHKINKASPQKRSVTGLKSPKIKKKKPNVTEEISSISTRPVSRKSGNNVPQINDSK